MFGSVGIETLVGLIVVGAVLVGLGFALVRRKNRLRRPRNAADEGFLADAESRLEVLESTPVDAERRLLLVRCDDVEHLIMVGGPADVVVENDVRKQRAEAKPASKPSTGSEVAIRSGAPLLERPAAAMPARIEHAAAGTRPAEQIAAEHKQPQPSEARAPESKSPESKPAEAPARTAAAPRPALTAVPAAANQASGKKEAGHSAPAATQDNRPGPAARSDDAGDERSGKPRQQAPEPQTGGRRDAAAPAVKRAPPVQAPTVVANQAEEPVRIQPVREPSVGGDLRATAKADAGAAAKRPVGLPSAEVPWPEADSVENEIVRALTAESNFAAPQGVHAPQVAATAGKPASDPATTLGDLAERLEEALAREVQSASKGRGRAEPNLDTFAFDRSEPERGTPDAKLQVQKDRREAPKVMASVPDPEVRRDRNAAPERQEEAPVISLNARRREAVDPLEDEMARLLGELTGDTNRR